MTLVSEATMTPAIGPLRETALPQRSGPVVIAAGGREVSATLHAGALAARRLERDMAIVAVIEPLPAGIWDADNGVLPGTFWEERAAVARHRVESAVGADERWPAWSLAILDGEVPRTIACAASEARSPLIVMGIGRSRPLDRLLGTDTVLRTLRVADCPVLAVAPSFTATPGSAAVGVDFSRSSIAAAESVAPLLAPDATLHLVHVWQPANAVDDASAKDDDLYRRHLPDRFRQFIAALDLPARLEVKSETREGHPAECLTDFAAAHHVDVIAVGRHGRNFIQRLLVGGVAERVLRNAHCSVLIAPEPTQQRMARAKSPDADLEQIVKRIDWSGRLDAFARQNAGHVVALEVNDPEHSVTSQALGYILFGTSCEEPHGLIRIVLGETNGRREHATRIISNATRLSIASDAQGADLALRIQHGSGETVLTVNTHRGSS